MVDRSKARATNPTLPQAAEARLKRSGFMTLKSLKRPDAVTAAAEHCFPQKLVAPFPFAATVIADSNTVSYLETELDWFDFWLNEHEEAPSETAAAWL